MSNSRNFIIYSPSYKGDSGGIIVLHKLCHILNEQGHKAYLWPDRIGTKQTYRKKLRNQLFPKHYITNPEFNTPVAKSSDLSSQSLVIYPETVIGNPLKGRRIARWLLHKPGFHTGKVGFTPGELIFAFDDYCIDTHYDIDPKNKLFVLALNSAYNAIEVGAREGSCYMMRKGLGRTLVHDLAGSIQVDGLDHEELAAVFRKTKYFYCYDELTLYSQYAALCGCISIVIPDQFKTRAEWVKNHPISKYGIAYGLDDVNHAVETQGKVAEYFQDLEKESRETVSRFVEVTDNYEF